MFTLTAALTAGSATVRADTPTVQEMDQYVAKMAAQVLEILANLEPKELWVAPSGKPTNSGAKESPMKGQGTPKVVFEKNTYIDNGRFDLAEFQAFINSGQTDRVTKGQDGRPSDRYVFKRVNRYEPQRVHLAVYNWPQTPTAPLDLSDVLKTGQKYRIVEVHDIWGKPLLEGTFDGQPIEIKMSGPYAPEFGCYMLFRAGATVEVCH